MAHFQTGDLAYFQTGATMELTTLQNACFQPYMVATIVSDEVVECIGPTDPGPNSVQLFLRQVEVVVPLDALVGLPVGTVIWMTSSWEYPNIIHVVPPPATLDGYPTMTAGDELLWVNLNQFTNTGTYDCGGITFFYRAQVNRLRIRTVNEIPGVMADCETDIYEDEPRVLKNLDTESLRNRWGPEISYQP